MSITSTTITKFGTGEDPVQFINDLYSKLKVAVEYSYV